MPRHIRIACAGIALSALLSPAVAQREIQKPKDNWQKPGEIQKPRDTWQTPGEIQVPKGIQAIRADEERCAKRFVVGADALFEFDKATLAPDAEETLKALVPLLAKAGQHPVSIEGHTDGKGSDAYNRTLSEKRAQSVKDWLAARGAVPGTAATKGWGERRPVAPNTHLDGGDDPAGRQKNRRVEVILDLCGKAG
jgi:outer membrane protein OmpA-like peptidoglycan-associated protein